MKHPPLRTAIATTLVGALSLLIGCDRGESLLEPDPTVPPNPTEPVLASELVVVDSTVMRLVSDSMQMSEGELRFRVQGAGLTIVAGDLVAGAERRGFLGRATSVTREGEELVVRTSPASMSEAVENGSFRIQSSLSLGDQPAQVRIREGPIMLGPTEAVYLAPGVSTAASGELILDGFSLVADLCDEEQEGNPDEEEGNPSDPCAELRLAVERGRISFDPNIDFRVQFRPREVDFLASGELAWEFYVSLSASVLRQEEYKRTLATIRKPFVAHIGVLPVVGEIRMNLKSVAKVELGATGRIAKGLEGVAGVQVGVEYRADHGWTGIAASDVISEHAPVEWDLGGHGRIRAGLVPEFEIILYTRVGGSVGYGPFAQVLGTLSTTDCSWSAAFTAGLEGSVDVRVHILWRINAEYTHAFPPVDLINAGYSGVLSRDLQEVGGNGQTGPMGERLAEPLRVRIVGPDGRPLFGIPLTFGVLEGGGSVTPQSTLTDLEGTAEAVWTLGSQPGLQTVEVSVPSCSSEPMLFQAHATEAREILTGRVVDQSTSNPVPDVTVTSTEGFVTSDASGQFTVPVASSDDELVFSSSGIHTRRTFGQGSDLDWRVIPAAFDMGLFDEVARSLGDLIAVAENDRTHKWTGGSPRVFIDTRNHEDDPKYTPGDLPQQIRPHVADYIGRWSAGTVSPEHVVLTDSPPADGTVGTIVIRFVDLSDEKQEEDGETLWVLGRTSPWAFWDRYEIVAGVIELDLVSSGLNMDPGLVVGREIGHVFGMGQFQRDRPMMMREVTPPPGTEFSDFEADVADIVYSRLPGTRSPDTEERPAATAALGAQEQPGGGPFLSWVRGR